MNKIFVIAGIMFLLYVSSYQYKTVWTNAAFADTTDINPNKSSELSLLMREMYNHAAVRTELSGVAWRGTSDTEVMIAAIDRWGVEATLPRVHGMFAIAVWDQQERHLTLARDRLGEKPLYYGLHGGALLFGSVNKGGGNIVITLPTSTFSFGLDLMAEADFNADPTAGQLFNLNVDGTNYAVNTAQRPTRTFFGVSSDTAFSSITITMNNTTFPFRVLPILDNFSFSESQVRNVPEPGSLALIGLALAGAALARRRA